MTRPKPSLSAVARQALEQIVGARWVTTDPALLTAHAWNTGVGKVPGSEKVGPVWPLAAVLPATTEEVAAIVKCCLRHGLNFRPHSTGYGSMSNVKDPHSIVLDLRRMTTLEIDPAHRMAIVGPYVTAGMLQAVALKHGLTCHIVGAGPAHSPLASATSLIGVGITSQGTSMNQRNLLAWEWVTPQGEIVRGGAAGAGAGWFTGEGPGPGVRGMVRGFVGGSGGLGVFTKMGYKLYPVPVQGPLADTGRLPQLGLPIPGNAGFFQAVWPDWERHREATFALIDEHLCFAMLRMPADHIGWTVTGTNADYVRQLREGTLSDVARAEHDKSWTLLTFSSSAAEHAWRSGAVRDIVERTGGRLLPLRQDDAEVLYRNLFTSQYVPRVLRPSGGITTSFGVLDSFHFMPRVIEAGEECLGGDNRPGGPLVEGSREENWAWPHEGRYMWSENIVDFDPASETARVAAARALLSHYRICWQQPVGTLPLGLGPLMEVQGERISAPQHLIRAVKHHLDPVDASRSPDFIPFQMPALLQKVLPPLRPVLFSKPVLGLAARGIAKAGM
jgi:glycolate oxidase